MVDLFSVASKCFTNIKNENIKPVCLETRKFCILYHSCYFFCIFTCKDFQKVCFCYQFSSLILKIHSPIKILSLEFKVFFSPYFRTGLQNVLSLTIFSTKMENCFCVLQIFSIYCIFFRSVCSSILFCTVRCLSNFT